MKELTVLSVSFKTPRYIEALIRSFEKFKPQDLHINYIIVENSSLQYSEELDRHSSNVLFINNPTPETGAYANASGIEKGKHLCDTDYTFVCHSDIIVTSTDFFNILFEKQKQGCELVGALADTARIKALHISAILIKTSILQAVNTYPVVNGIQGNAQNWLQLDTVVCSGNAEPGGLDVGDSLTYHARKHNIKHHCLLNTQNYPDYAKIIKGKWAQLKNLHLTLTLNKANEVIFIHLGRGTPKALGLYHKPNRVYSEDWLRLSEKILNE